ncbi:putative ABC transporter ATP-binding protein YxlF [Planctomycetes bacterium Pla163]|uniref:Putative ABC transporter ATP-binding protein YxlF n=1 Tax=Rohdeia mirabilis TaxID=2528008 RepID=A0A518D2H4_9BACT|nr:putative ABC transporter ATP-binding protein YxlF [Planctomycetes bacterium Pla163]
MIEVEDFTKRYGRDLAVERFSARIAPGEIVGFLGPNGAGKSTLLKSIATWAEPTSGTIRVAGHDTRTDPLAVRRVLGYLPEHNPLYEGMNVDAFLRFVGRARRIRGARLEERMAWVTNACTLGDVLHKRVNQCSKGFRQRIGLAAALLHDPRAILLDEPTHGLDPVQVAAFRDFLFELRDGRAILFSSHVLAEVEAICDRVLVIHRGRLVRDAAIATLQDEASAAGTTLEALVLELVRDRPAASEVHS